MHTTQRPIPAGEYITVTPGGTYLSLNVHYVNGSLVIGIDHLTERHEVAPMTLEQNEDNPSEADIWLYDPTAPGMSVYYRTVTMTDPITHCIRAWADYTSERS